MNDDSSIGYESSERRNALRVTPKDHKLSLDNGRFKLSCLDISFDGIGLASDENLPTDIGEVVAFILDENDNVVGKVKARLIYKQASRSGWQFTAMEDSVREFVDELVLELQKSELRAAASKRMQEEEKKLLDLDD